MIVDRTEDPIKYFGSNIVGNIVDYRSSSNEEKEHEKKEEDTPSKRKFESSTEATTTSVPIATKAIKPSTPPTQVAVVTTIAV